MKSVKQACCLILPLIFATTMARAEVIVQYFETEWDEMYQRLPEMAEIGFEGIWHPSPTKSPVAGVFPNGYGGNVGYNLFDRYDLGDRPQRGTLATRYGTRGSLRRMVDNAHQTGVKIYPDIVFNHTGNGPHIDTYPGMRYYDFHGYDDNTQPLNFRRAPRMNDYDPNDGDCDANFQQELVSLFDIQIEPDRRFSGAVNTCGVNMVNPGNVVRFPGDYERYPFHNPGDALPTEYPYDFMLRWINWLGYAMDWDGVRLDAPKHVVREFFGEPGYGFNHEIQWNLDNRRGFTGEANEYDEMYTSGIDRDDALIFGEMFIYDKGEISYWRDWNGGAGPDNASGVKMRYLDFPLLKQMMNPAFNDGNMAALSGFSAFGDKEGITFVHSHDEDSLWKKELGYAYALTHVGIPIVYFTGNNFDGNHTGWKSWLLQGYENAMNDWGGSPIPNLIYIHNNFAWGNEWGRWADGDVFIYERYDDIDNSDSPNSPEGLLLVGLNDSGGDQWRTVSVAFPDGTILKDYTGNNGSDLTVSGGQVNMMIPGMGGQGFVCYAPYNASGNGDPIRFAQGSGSPTNMNWDVPGGKLSPGSKSRTVTRVTDDNLTIDVYFNEPAAGGMTVDSVMIKWGQGSTVNTNVTFFEDDNNLRIDGYHQASQIASGHWQLTTDISNIPDGLHLIQARAFNGRPGGHPALFQTFREVIYKDTQGPQMNVLNLSNSETIIGDRVIEIENPDKSAGWIEARIDNGTWVTTHEVMRGTWKFAIQGLAAGAHTIDLLAHEYDQDTPAAEINSTTQTISFTVSDPGFTLSMNHSEGSTQNLPFFQTSGNKDAGKTIRLFWDGFEMDDLTDTGTAWEQTFTGAYKMGGASQNFWGAFVNGVHFFEAHLDDGAGTTQVVARTVFFDLYGKAGDFFLDGTTTGSFGYDSDGDGLPDDIEIYGFGDGSNPGPNVVLPGDTNNDNIPNNGEVWSRLNPMNHDTTYNGTWDGDEDWDGDGFSNLCEVRQGFLEHGNPAHYNIYDFNSKPTTCTGSTVAPSVNWTPNNPQGCVGATLTIDYEPNDGPLSNATPIWVSVGYNNWTATTDMAMSPVGGAWQYVYTIPTNATDIEWVFRDATSSVFDNNSGNNWTSTVSACVISTNYFTMDGSFDSENYEIANTGMKILAAVKDNNLYFSTWSANGNTSDHFLLVTDKFQDPEGSPWGKDGNVFMNLATKPYLASESDPGTSGFHAINNAGVNGRVAMGSNGNALEGELNLLETFGYLPEIVYITAVAYGDNDGDGILSQCPGVWDSGNTIEIMEMLPVPIDSIRDEDLDGHFDCGIPRFESVVNGNTNDANYNIRRFYINEVIDETEFITFNFSVATDAGEVVDTVELISNLNRRDFATFDYDLETTDTTNPTNYFRAYTMSPNGSGGFTISLPVHKTGAYRVTVRYDVDGQTYYYTDYGLRKDLAIVASPEKARNINMYELNPMAAEASDTTFAGRSTFYDMYTANTNRSDYVNLDHFSNLNVNMIWLQPIHPIGTDNRQTDPITGTDYDPGSPYAIKNYWKINAVLGNPATTSQALSEFQTFVSELDSRGIGVMLDAPFNHSAWDCEIGQPGVDAFPWATSETELIRDIRPQWYSKAGNYGQRASSYINQGNTDIAPAPDRNDFGKWSDAADFNFGISDTLVQGQSAANLNNFLLERDWWAGHDAYSPELWEYFARYAQYWLEQTGHPAGTPKSQSFKGIDGLRCDFAQGLPSVFWEYVINLTRSTKWDFLFMAESLDGFREVNGDPRHGLSFRSARHFDILNENIVFYWRDTFFAYEANGSGSAGTPTPSTAGTFTHYDDRKNAYDNVMLLNNMTSHDEVFPSDNPYSSIYAYAQLAGLDGLPLIMYGQEAGAKNDFVTYGFRTGLTDANNNWEIYEDNFGKSIPNFKRYNAMSKVWENRDWNLQEFYGRINGARLASPALRSQQNYFLGKKTGGGYNDDIFAVAKYQQAGLTAAQQDVVFVFSSNDHVANPNVGETYDLNVETSPGVNWFGIQLLHSYEIHDLLATNPTANVWGVTKSGTDLINNGLFVGLPYQGQQASYLKLVDVSEAMLDNDADGYSDATDDDDDNDGMKDSYETANGLSPTDATGINGAEGDLDLDGVSNREEMISGTNPDDINDFLAVDITMSGTTPEVEWNSVVDKNYQVEKSSTMEAPIWSNVGPLQTANSVLESEMDASSGNQTSMFYRVKVK